MDNNIRIRVAKEHKEWLIKQAEEKGINGDKTELYFDAYKKQENICFNI